MAILRRLLALLAVGALMFCALEVGACAYLKAFRGYDGEHLMSYQFDPYKTMRLTRGFRDTRGIQHNAQGFRASEPTPREKPPGTLRVFLMGGSTAYGIGGLSAAGKRAYPLIRNDETIDHYLERSLEGAVPGWRVEVVNAAITSFQSHHHLIYLNQAILEYDPDLIVFLDGFNDYYPIQPGFDQFRDYAYQQRAAVFMGEPTLRAWASYTAWWLVRKSAFFHMAGHAGRNLWHLLTAERGENTIDVDRALENLRDNARRNWVQMVERNGLILDREGVDAIFALQPEIAFRQGKTFSELEETIYQEMLTHWPENYIDFKNRARPVVLELLREATAGTGAHPADLTDIYGEVEGDVYTDYCHLTPLGNRVLAEHLARQVGRLLRQRVGPGGTARMGS